ncbi:MAG: hypothetical protein MUE37_14235 [Bacteroidales bacterium]|jgi:hypothetical protein|nr:hypothetical protein [Bacteroidales bacterium]
MKHDIRYAMRLLASFLVLIPLSLITVNGQSSQGTLKVFSENPLVVYVDGIHYPQYGEIKLAPGTHWLKAINAEGVRVYSEIVSLKANEVTSVLIEEPNIQAPAMQTQQGQVSAGQAVTVQTGVTYGQPAAASGSNQTAGTGTVTESPVSPSQTIDIGQIGGRLPRDMSGAFGLGFGMAIREVDQIMTPKAAQAQRNTGYNVYAIPNGSSVYLVECRFMDNQLFQIIVGYVSTYSDNSKLKLDKKEVPFPEYNRMLSDLTGIYGNPDSTEKIFMSGYAEGDGRLLEALRRKKALIYHTWTDETTGNNIIMGLGYTSAPLAATIYTSGPMSTEAAARKLRLHAYSYNKSFKDNYFSN